MSCENGSRVGNKSKRWSVKLYQSTKKCGQLRNEDTETDERKFTTTSVEKI